MKKKKKILIIIAIVTVVIVVFSVIFRDQLFLRMPAFFIGNHLEKKVPIGSSVEDVIEFVKSHEEWFKDESQVVRCYEHPMTYDSGEACYPDGSYSCYSFSDIDYKGNPDKKFGSYTIHVDCGTMSNIPIFATWVNVFFVFDEEQKLIDIVVSKEFAGI